MGPMTRAGRSRTLNVLRESTNDNKHVKIHLNFDDQPELQSNSRLKAFLKDFEIQANCREKQFQKTIQQYCNSIWSAYNLSIQNIPREHRDMTMAQFLAAGGEFQQPEDEINKLLSNILPAQATNIIRGKRKKNTGDPLMMVLDEFKSSTLQKKQKSQTTSLSIVSAQKRSNQSETTTMTRRNLSTMTAAKNKKQSIQEKLNSQFGRQTSNVKKVGSITRVSRNVHSKNSRLLNDSDFLSKPLTLKKHKKRSTSNSSRYVENLNVVSEAIDEGKNHDVASVLGNTENDEKLFVMTKDGDLLTIINAFVPTILLPVNGKTVIISPDSKVQDLPCEGNFVKHIYFLHDKLAEYANFYSENGCGNP